MPLRLGFIAQTSNGGWVDLFDWRPYASRAPELKSTHCVLSRGLEISQEVGRACQSAIGTYQERGVFLLLRQLNKLVAPTPATEAAPPPPSEEVLLLREIRDGLKSR